MRTKKLGEVLEKIPKIVGVLTKDYLDEGMFPIVDQGQSFIAGYTNDIASVYCGELPVVIFGDHTRAMKFIDFPFAIGADGTKILKPTSEFDAKFFYYFLLSINIPARGYARHYSLLREFKIPLPTVGEQKKIVARIEKQFAKIDEAACLRAESLASTEQIFPAILHEIFSSAESKEWGLVSITNEAFFQEGPGIRSYEYEDDGYPMINVRCVQDGRINLTGGKAASRELAEGKWKHFQVQVGDILFTTSGTIGRVAVVQEYDLPLLMNTSVVRFRTLDESRLANDFLYWVLRSPDFVNGLKVQSTGSAQQNVGPSHIKKMQIPLPPLAEQKEIVKKLDALSEKVRALQELQSAQATDLKALKQSILHEAFSG
ncbi:MAG: restriction endonuclease subunit S [Candidatus Paceibacterota bacterium]